MRRAITAAMLALTTAACAAPGSEDATGTDPEPPDAPAVTQARVVLDEATVHGNDDEPPDGTFEWHEGQQAWVGEMARLEFVLDGTDEVDYCIDTPEGDDDVSLCVSGGSDDDVVSFDVDLLDRSPEELIGTQVQLVAVTLPTTADGALRGVRSAPSDPVEVRDHR